MWIALVVVSFFIPNGFFMFYGNYVSMIGATVFILVGLVLLVDFAHSWSETCLERWEEIDSNFWKFVLIGSTLGLFALSITLTGVMYGFFAGSGCALNRFFITFNLILSLIVTGLSVSPPVQEANPRSGLAQSAMVVAYTAYLITSAIANHDDDKCNPLQSRAAGARTGMVVLGAVFTFVAIAYSTSRAATQSRALVGKGNRKPLNDGGYSTIPGTAPDEEVTTEQPGKTHSLRTQALMAAVAAGSLPASALDEDDEDESDEGVAENDDERRGTRYNYSWFHVIFLMATMYTAMLLTNWCVYAQAHIKSEPNVLYRNVVQPAHAISADPSGAPVKIGRSHVAMWMRVVSSWICLVLYGWSLVAPVVMPDRFE